MNAEEMEKHIKEFLELKDNEELTKWTMEHLSELNESFFQALEDTVKENPEGGQLVDFMKQITAWHKPIADLFK